jgi:hypothetical protein
MRWVFVTTVAGTVVAASAVAAQTTSAPPAAALRCARRAGHRRPSRSANAWNAFARWGHPDALALNQQHSITKQRRPLSAHPRPPQSGAGRSATQCHLTGANTARRGYSGRAGTVDGPTEGWSERPKSCRQ